MGKHFFVGATNRAALYTARCSDEVKYRAIQYDRWKECAKARITATKLGSLAQSVEQLAFNQLVTGSTKSSGTILRWHSQPRSGSIQDVSSNPVRQMERVRESAHHSNKIRVVSSVGRAVGF